MVFAKRSPAILEVSNLFCDVEVSSCVYSFERLSFQSLSLIYTDHCINVSIKTPMNSFMSSAVAGYIVSKQVCMLFIYRCKQVEHALTLE